jgi:hypothetical protein
MSLRDLASALAPPKTDAELVSVYVPGGSFGRNSTGRGALQLALGTEIRDEAPERRFELRRPHARQLVRTARPDRGSALEPLAW